MLVDLNEVLKNDGKVLQMNAVLDMKSYTSVQGEFPIIRKEPVSLHIQNKGNRELFITGMTELVFLVPCDRCLEDVEVPLKLQFEREADLKQSEGVQKQESEEQYYIDGYNLDVDKLVCSEILVSWPSKVLCAEDCKGICPTCGTNLNLGTCDCEPTDLDPRMAKIQEIFTKFKEV
ncbi:MAG: DUF177 domain-containing protein [Eubacteriales bacterium]|nr:DUF177 domain-containing protein [Eubacteriales bacterium]